MTRHAVSDRVVRGLSEEVTYQQILRKRETGSKDMRKSILGSASDKCKSPEAGLFLASGRIIQWGWSKVGEVEAD